MLFEHIEAKVRNSLSPEQIQEELVQILICKEEIKNWSFEAFILNRNPSPHQEAEHLHRLNQNIMFAFSRARNVPLETQESQMIEALNAMQAENRTLDEQKFL